MSMSTEKYKKLDWAITLFWLLFKDYPLIRTTEDRHKIRRAMNQAFKEYLDTP